MSRSTSSMRNRLGSSSILRHPDRPMLEKTTGSQRLEIACLVLIIFSAIVIPIGQIVILFVVTADHAGWTKVIPG